MLRSVEEFVELFRREGLKITPQRRVIFEALNQDDSHPNAEGNWDLVGNNTPVFFIRDAIKFPDFIHTPKRVPQTNPRSPAMWWDFWAEVPESLHQVTILFSDRGIPAGIPYMNGYGSHTYSFINAQDERFWVKWYRPKCQAPIRCLAFGSP